MDKQTVFHKTEKGLQEVATRALGLPARERSVLILVDGKSTVQQIIDKTRHFGDAEQFLSNLLGQGFIERLVLAPASEVLPATAAQPEPGTASAPAVSLESAKKFAAHFLLDEIGPDADPMAERIEACMDIEQLVTQLEKYRDVLEATRGKRRAELFWQGVEARVPEY
jgi:hypothetical protein